MLINGMWHVYDDGIITWEMQAYDGSWGKAPFLLDTGADRTALSADILQALRFHPVVTETTWWSWGHGACDYYRNPYSGDS